MLLQCTSLVHFCAPLCWCLDLLARFIVRLRLQVAPAHIDVAGFQRLLSGKNVQSAVLRAEYLFRKMDTNEDGFVDVPEYVNKRLLSAGEFLCHAPEDLTPEEYKIAFPGCPCNPIDSPDLGACPAGGILSVSHSFSAPVCLGYICGILPWLYENMYNVDMC